MFDKISRKRKKTFILNSFVYFPISFLLSLVVLLGMSIAFKVKLTIGTVIFVVGSMVLTSVGLIYRYYKKLCGLEKEG